MLQLKNIVKTYSAFDEDQAVHALRGVDLAFRDSEFVAVLGPSGCGKTTLLNILGGLDRYTDGDLIINGRSTKEYNDGDWDTYRNHSIGFVFQSYNLIPHQTVLANVELALTLSGVSRNERRRRAVEALEKVGLGDQIHKKPNQMSGGQMQRVAIARALVNDPDILLADEPTGALDTVTSVQIMEILKEISKDKLILMVTHNPELAETYANRIVRLVDGQVKDDSNPYTAEQAEADAETRRASQAPAKKTRKKSKKDDGTGKGKRSMSFATALSLSFQNLMTKKGRTLLTSFAGSIGIIGIALILALSNGVTMFIATVQEDTLSTYPLTIEKHTQDYQSMLSAMMNVSGEMGAERDDSLIYVDDSMGTMMSAMSSTVENNLEAFKAYLDTHEDELADYVTDIQYTYDYDLQVFNMVAVDKDGETVLDAREIGMDVVFDHMGDAFSGMSELMEMGGSLGSMGMDVFTEMIDNQELLDQQYDVIAGQWPTAYNEVVLVVTSNNQLSKMTLYMLGMLDPDNIEKELSDLMAGQYEPGETQTYTFDDILGTKFMLLTTADFFRESGRFYGESNELPIWEDVRERLDYDRSAFVSENGEELKISGIIRPKTGTAATSISGAIGYTKALTDHILEKNAQSAVINQQKETPSVNVLTGLPFERTHYTPETIHELVDKIDAATMDMFYAYMTQQILSNPDFADRIQVTDTESFIGMFMLLPESTRADIFAAVLTAASANPENADNLDKLCRVLSMSTGGVTITPKNFVKLLPILDLKTQILGALMGIPATPPMIPEAMPGLIEMAGDTAMQAIYTQLTEGIKNMTVNREIFVALLGTLTVDDPAFIQLEETLYSMAPQIDATLESVLDVLDDAERAKPYSINFFAVDFESKEKLTQFIADYNGSVEEKDQLKYTDVVGIMMSSVTTIIDAISYVLIAFVSISLVVSSIMIGIITYISVLERTKEIGILRAIGASKRDVSRVFNAETLIIGFTAGAIGILFTVLTYIPVTLILRAVTDIPSITAALPWAGGVALVIISMVLTFVAGLFPAGVASRKDPVIALRSE